MTRGELGFHNNKLLIPIPILKTNPNMVINEDGMDFSF